MARSGPIDGADGATARPLPGWAARVPGWLLWPSLVFLIGRSSLLVVNWLSRSLLPQAYQGTPGLVYGWTNWDAWYYVSIATAGYSFDPGQQSNMAFFPLYPLLVRAAALVVPNPYVA